MKKLISIILCLVIVLSMAVSAFAATANPPTNIPGNTNPVPVLPNNPAPAEQEVIRIDLDGEDEEPEENPTTGAPVFAVPAVIAAVAAAAVIGKRK